MTLRYWFAVQGEGFGRFYGLAASFASIASVVPSYLTSQQGIGAWAVFALVVAGLGFAYQFAIECFRHANRFTYPRTDREKIRQFMHDWIKNGSKVAIWSRDLSWAQNPETRHLLREKAHANDLVICLPEETPLALELRSEGAELRIYGSEVLESPRSRFTITYLGRAGSRVAVGKTDGDSHVIDIFEQGAQPFHLAEDLVELAKGLSRRRSA